jgi:TetR/AcrR family transcriptional regulator
MAASKTKPKSLDGSARQRLLYGAIELFNQKGYAGTTVREIVEAAKVTKPVLYYYFRNKEGIYLELMRDTFGKFERLLIISQEEKGSVRERLLRFCDRSFSLFLEDIRTVRIMYAIYYGPHQGAPFFDFNVYHIKFQEAVRRFVDEGIQRGEIRPGNPEDMTWVIIGAINVAMEVELGHPEMEKMKLGREGLGRVLNLIFQGLGNKKKRPAGGRK